MASNFSKNLVRAPNLASNFHLHNDADNCKFDCFDWKVTLCNFWGYYTKYYTFIKNTHKSLIYIVFFRAGFPVNQRFCDLFIILMQRFVEIDLNCFK